MELRRRNLSPVQAVMLFLPVFLLNPVVDANTSKNPCDFPAVFNFGDSNSDTGGLSAAFGQAGPPHGESFFHGPAGRYCDGRLVIDFIGNLLVLHIQKIAMLPATTGGSREGQPKDFGIINFKIGPRGGDRGERGRHLIDIVTPPSQSAETIEGGTSFNITTKALSPYNRANMTNAARHNASQDVVNMIRQIVTHDTTVETTMVGWIDWENNPYSNDHILLEIDPKHFDPNEFMGNPLGHPEPMEEEYHVEAGNFDAEEDPEEEDEDEEEEEEEYQPEQQPEQEEVDHEVISDAGPDDDTDIEEDPAIIDEDYPILEFGDPSALPSYRTYRYSGGPLWRRTSRKLIP
ncbi:hypothetical protein LXL04_020803 [Taraxacum kok-saghyz]